MRMFTLDDEVIQSKARTASNKIGSVAWNLAEAEKIVLKAIEEINKHSELSGIAYGSILDKLEKTNDILEEYNQIESLVYDYCEEIDDNFFKEQEKILEGLSRLKVEDIRVPNNIGVVETRTIIEHGETYTYEVKKKDIGFEDLLTYGTVSEIMQDQYNQLKNIARENGQEFNGSINDYIKGLIEEGQFDYEVAWKKNTSLVIDLIPVVGDAKGIIECILGKDLITGRELSNLERGLCLLSIIPFVGDGGKIAGRFLKEGIQSAGKLFAKEATVNVVSYMGSAAMQEVGINPLLALAIYQGGRIGYKNISRNGLGLDYILNQNKIYSERLGIIAKDPTIEALIDLKVLNHVLDNNKELKVSFQEILKNKSSKELLFKNLADIDKSDANAVKRALQNTVNGIDNTSIKGVSKTGVGKTGEGIPLEEVKPDVLKQIHPDDNGAYGYLPNEGTAYHTPEYDFTNVDWAKDMQNVRKDYLEASKQLEIDIERMTSEGFSKEDIAKHVVDARNQQKVTARANMTAEERVGLEARNIELYGNPIGPDSQWLFDKTKKKLFKEGKYISDNQIWEIIIEKSMVKDDVINTLLGLIH